MTRCLGCMKEYDGNTKICPHCGYDNDSKPKEIYHIVPGSILEGRYLIGKSVGQGGFGITYVGWDLQLERKVAIKEYFPSDFATRVIGNQKLTIYNGEAGDQFGAGLQSFIDEAQRLAKFNGVKGVVDIYDTFITNNTGYIVMEFLSGITVKDMLKANQTIDYPTAKEIVVEVLYILREVHKDGIIHRDIAPDNIFITESGEIKLLDFGAARYATTTHSKSLSVILKPGYAPVEQYRSHGDQGPWTDIYALAATFYKLITGVTPTESMERRSGDNLQPPSKLGVAIPKNDEITLLNALNVLPENRVQNAQEFLDALGGKRMVRKKERNLKADTGKMYKFVVPLIASAFGIVAVFFILVQVGVINLASLRGDITNVFSLPDGYRLVKNEVNVSQDIAEEQFVNDEVEYVVYDSVYSDTIAENSIAGQFPLGGTSMASDSKVNLVVSLGPNKLEISLVNNLNANEVINNLKSLGFYNIQQLKGEKNEIVSGTIEKVEIVSDLSAEGAEFEEVKEGETYPFYSAIRVYVSDGSNFKEEESKVDVPNLVGTDINNARQRLASIGLVPSVRYTQNSRYDNNEVVSQNPASGQVNVGSTVVLTVNNYNSNDDVVVPNIVNLSESAASSRLSSAGLSGSVTREYNNNYREGMVISQSVAAGREVSRGSTVSYVVSRGPAPTTTTTERTTQKTTERTTERTTRITTTTTKRTTTTETTTKKDKIEVSPSSMKFSYVGEDYTVSCNKTISSIVSDDPSVAKVNGKKVVAVGNGSTTIRVNADGQEATISVKVSIPEPDEDIRIMSFSNKQTLPEGNSTYLTYTVYPGKYQNQVFLEAVGGEGIADVSNGNYLYGRRMGTTTLTCNFYYKDKLIDSRSLTVTVTEPEERYEEEDPYSYAEDD